MKTSFDKIYVLHLATDTFRYKTLTYQFEQLGLDYEIWWTSKRPFSTDIALKCFGDTIRTEFYDGYSQDVYGNVFNCTFEHYSIIKQAFERGFENILICEDDINFKANIKDYIEYVFNNLPENYSLIKYYCTDLNDRQFYQHFSRIDSNNPGWFRSTLCYALSRDGMQQYIDIVENNFCAADVIFKYFDTTNVYLTKAICKPLEEKSNILTQKL